MNDTGNGATATPASDVTTNAVINIVSGTNMNGNTFRPMIRLASIADDSYVPYAKTNVELTKLTEYDAKYNSAAYMGYSKFPDGTMIEWGLSGSYASGNSKTITVNLIVPFIDTNYSVTATGFYGGADASNYEVIATARRISESQFEIHCKNPTANYTNAVHWTAVGRWK